MNPGTILHDPQFTFADGELGNKLLVVLNDGKDGIYIVIKTTSQPKQKGRNDGCQLKDRPPNFYVPDGSCCLRGESWFLLVEFYDLKAAELQQKVFVGSIRRIGELPKDLLIELLACAIDSFDIRENQREDLQRVLNSL
ncbi:MAG TPA: hypothetical protein VLJ61_18830 [Pyrinomonadaceae bacterium]|nr:hypothetical protein [Pyrinomonadaceae bacterium]